MVSAQDPHWFVAIELGEVSLGPYPKKTLRRMLRDGSLESSAWVRGKGEEGWRPLAQLLAEPDPPDPPPPDEKVWDLPPEEAPRLKPRRTSPRLWAFFALFLIAVGVLTWQSYPARRPPPALGVTTEGISAPTVIITPFPSLEVEERLSWEGSLPVAANGPLAVAVFLDNHAPFFEAPGVLIGKALAQDGRIASDANFPVDWPRGSYQALVAWRGKVHSFQLRVRTAETALNPTSTYAGARQAQAKSQLEELRVKVKVAGLLFDRLEEAHLAAEDGPEAGRQKIARLSSVWVPRWRDASRAQEASRLRALFFGDLERELLSVLGDLGPLAETLRGRWAKKLPRGSDPALDDHFATLSERVQFLQERLSRVTVAKDPSFEIDELALREYLAKASFAAPVR